MIDDKKIAKDLIGIEEDIVEHEKRRQEFLIRAQQEANQIIAKRGLREYLKDSQKNKKDKS